MIDDKKSREIIAQDLKHNYFVEASAGSGKTYSLVLRMVALIESGVPINEICTITFTKAAANEFFSRFQKMLSIRSVEGPDGFEDSLGKKDKKTTIPNCQKALANIDLCFLGTIDAFLNTIAHELPFQLKLPSDSEIIDANERSRLIREKYEEILKDPKHKYHDKAVYINSLFSYSRDAFEKTFDVVSKNRHCEIIYDKKLFNTDINKAFSAQEKSTLASIAKILCSNVVAYAPKENGDLNDKYEEQAKLKGALRYIINPDWSNSILQIENAIAAMKKMDNVLKTPYNDILVNSGLFNPLANARSSNIKYKEEIKKFFDYFRDKIENYKHSVMFDFIMSVMDEVCDELKDAGALGFFDYLYYVKSEFKKSASTDRILVDHILERHSHFLLDESQDTDPMQTELFFYLTGTKITDDWTKTEPREGSLFIVGDPKQSIYRFRGASVQAYLKTKSIFESKDQVLYLTQNFRSRAVLKKWFNDTMNDVLYHEDKIESIKHPNIPIEQKQIEEEDASVDFDNNKFALYQGAYRYFSTKKTDPENAAKIIADLVKSRDKVIIKKNGEKGYISYGDIRLVPRGKKVGEYVKALTKYNIPTIIEAKIPFGESQTLLAIRDLLFLLKDPTDKTAFMFVAYGNLYKLNHFDILNMKLDGFDLDISKEPVSFKNPKHQKIIDALHNAYLKTKDMSFSSTLLFILNDEELNIYKHLDTTYLEYAFFLVEKVKEKEESGLMSGLEECKEFINTFIFDNEEDDRTLRFKDDLDRVILSNVHKVKGLQAPIVILAEPESFIVGETSHADYLGTTPTYTLAELGDFDAHATYVRRHDINESETNKWKEYGRAEKERVEYVGATRAESVLIVARATKLDPRYYDTWVDLTNDIDDEHTISVPEIEPTVPNSVNVTIGTYNKNINCNNQSINFHLPSSSYGEIKLSSMNNNLDNVCEDFESREDATIVGTMVHKLMEKIASSHNAFSNIEEAIVDIMLEYGGLDYHDLLLDVYSTMTSGGYPQKNSGVEQDILDVLMKAEEVLCETPFSYKRKDGTIVSGIIDLIYKDKDGYHIIDYKTNQEDDVSILEKEYAGQLSDYQEALKEFGIDADAHIYHIDAK